jgi:hypothetical protein
MIKHETWRYKAVKYQLLAAEYFREIKRLREEASRKVTRLERLKQFIKGV